MHAPLEPLFKPIKILEKLEDTPLNSDCIKLEKEKETLLKEKANLERELEMIKKNNESLQIKYDIMYSDFKLAIAFQDQARKSLEKENSQQTQEINELKQQLALIDMLESQSLMNIVSDYSCFNENNNESMIDTLQRKLILLEEDYRLDVEELKRRIQDYIKERDDYKAELETQSVLVKQLVVEHQKITESVDEHRLAEAKIYFEEIKTAFQQQQIELKNYGLVSAEIECMKKKLKGLQATLEFEVEDNNILHRKYIEVRKTNKKLMQELSETKYLKRDFELSYIKSQESRESLRDKLRSLKDKYELKDKEFFHLKREYRSLKEQLKLPKESEQISNFTGR